MELLELGFQTKQPNWNAMLRS